MHQLRLIAVIILGKIIARLLMIFGSSATAFPGLIILKLYPDFLKVTIGEHPEKIILVTGTNGKTTTTHLLTHLLKKNGYRVFHNSEGSNMERGIASEVLKTMPLKFDWYVIESDEGSFSRLLLEFKPKTVLFLNIFRDQLDRYGEINGLMSKWNFALQKNLPEKIIFNTDDPNVSFVIQNVVAEHCPATTHKIGFSVETNSEVLQNPDRVFCPKCNGILRYSLSDFKCGSCGFGKMKAKYVLKEARVVKQRFPPALEFNGEAIGLPFVGKYNYYNLAAALSVLDVLASQHKPLKDLLQDFSPAFGRFEKINYKNKFFHVILAKNPAGVNNVLSTLFPLKGQDLSLKSGDGQTTKINLMICLNDKIADGEDVSWIYDADFENIQNSDVKMLHATSLQLIFSGARAYDLALRLKIAGFIIDQKNIQPDMSQAFEEFLNRIEKAKDSYVIVTYTCLMELQKIMYKRKLISKLM